MSNPVLQAALDFHSAGISVIPAMTDGSKAPIGSWKQFQVNRPTLEQIVTWFGTGHAGIGVVTGQVSGNLEMLELEGRAVAAKLHVVARDIAEASGLGELWELINNGYMEQTPSGGIHWLYRITDEPVPGNTKLARKPGENGTVEVLSETRGEGGFVVTAPSSGTTHQSGNPWQILTGSASSIPNISMEERNALHAIFKALDEMPTKEIIVQSMAKTTDSTKPGDDYNAKAKWEELLADWKFLYTSHGITYLRRPGKDMGISATIKESTGNLYVFTTSTTFEAERPYSKFAAFAHLQHGDDFSAAATALRRLGYGSGRVELAPMPRPMLVPDLDGDHIEKVPERSSWFPKPLDLEGTANEPEPTHLARNDGHRLFYQGKINALIGESESGKTWVALLAVTQSLQIAEKVMYLDFEDSARGILGRLRSMGMSDHQLANFVYANPDQNLTMDERIDLVDALLEFKPDLIIVDGVNAAMTLMNLDLTSNRDATYFSQQLLKPLALSGATTITIDHVTKNKDSRGSYAIGAQAKKADVSGCAIMVAVVAPFGRGTTGELTLNVVKDRAGHVRAVSEDSKHAGTVFLKSGSDGSVLMTLQSPRGRVDRLRPTHLMEIVSKMLEASDAPLSKTTITNNVKGKKEWVLIACQVLIDEGFVRIENGARNALNLHSIRQYRESDDSMAGIGSFDEEESFNATA